VILEFVKNVNVNAVMRQHNIRCVYMCMFTQNARTHTKCYAAASPH